MEHAEHAVAELFRRTVAFVFRLRRVGGPSGAVAFPIGTGHEMDEDIERERNLMRVFHGHFLVCMSEM